MDQDLARIGLLNRQGGQQCVPAVDGGLGLKDFLVEVPGESGDARVVLGGMEAQAGDDTALRGDHADPGDDLLCGLVVPAAGRSCELVEVFSGLGQAFVPGGLLARHVCGGVDQDSAQSQHGIALAGPVQGVGVLQHTVGLALLGLLPCVPYPGSSRRRLPDRG